MHSAIRAGLVGVVATAVAAISSSAEPRPDKEILSEAQERVSDLFQDISTINLLNALNLSRAQSEKILTLAREAKEARERLAGAKAEDFAAAMKEAEGVYAELRAEIQKGSPARGALEGRAFRAENRLKDMRDKAFASLAAKYKELDAELGKTLTPEQAQVVESFKPCLIPPKDLKDPVRAGQAASNERGVQMLQRLRKVPDREWQDVKGRMADRHVEEINKHRFKMTEAEKDAERRKVIATVEKVRAMSDTEFEMNKEQVASDMRPEDKMEELRKEIEERMPHQDRPAKSRVAQFLLGARIIPIIEERLKTAQ